MKKIEAQETFSVTPEEIAEAGEAENGFAHISDFYEIVRHTKSEFLKKEFWGGSPTIVWDGYCLYWKYEEGQWYRKHQYLPKEKWMPCETPLYEQWYKELQ